MEREKAVKSFERLLDIMDELRAKCPWDKEQTMESLRPLTIEETYELSDAILEKESTNIGKELGDSYCYLQLILPHSLSRLDILQVFSRTSHLLPGKRNQ